MCLYFLFVYRAPLECLRSSNDTRLLFETLLPIFHTNTIQYRIFFVQKYINECNLYMNPKMVSLLKPRLNLKERNMPSVFH